MRYYFYKKTSLQLRWVPTEADPVVFTVFLLHNLYQLFLTQLTQQKLRHFLELSQKRAEWHCSESLSVLPCLFDEFFNCPCYNLMCFLCRQFYFLSPMSSCLCLWVLLAGGLVITTQLFSCIIYLYKSIELRNSPR